VENVVNALKVWANFNQVQDFSKLTNLILKLNLVPKLLLIFLTVIRTKLVSFEKFWM